MSMCTYAVLELDLGFFSPANVTVRARIYWFNGLVF
jgi:hypothetical protein